MTLASLVALLSVAQTGEPPPPVLTKPPELLTFVHAAYPEALLARGVGGEVLLAIELDETGKVTGVSIVEATDIAFAGPARAAAEKFVFAPAEVDHAPAPIRIEYRYVFAPPAKAAEVVEKPVNFSGVVKEAGTRRLIAGAAVFVDDVVQGETDEQGRFALRGIAVGKHAVRIKAPLFELYDVEEEIVAGEELQATYYLLATARSPYETIVRTKQERREVARVQLSQAEVKKVPGTFGDPVRVIENLPGMGRSFAGLGGELIVHGSSPMDTAVYLDGVDIPNLYHEAGLVSVINAELLERVDFYPAAFGARYGRATAGVVDVTSKEISCDMVRGSAKLDAVDSAAFLCAPVGEWRLAAAGRRSWIDAILPSIMAAGANANDGSFTIAPIYWDYQAKAQRRLGKHSIDILGFGSYDTLELIQDGGNENLDLGMNAGIAWHRLMMRHRYKDERLTISSAVTPGYFTAVVDQSGEGKSAGEDTRFWSLNVREDLSLALSEIFTLNAGVDVHIRSANYSFPTTDNVEIKPYPGPRVDSSAVPAGSQMVRGAAGDYGHAYWLEVVAKTHGFTLVPGLRLDRFDIFKAQHLGLQPRFSARYDVRAGTTAKAAYGFFEKMSDVGFLRPDAGNPDLLPEKARHLMVGVEQALPLDLAVDLSGFYVWKSQLPSPTSEVVMRDGKVTPKVWDSTGTGRVFGLELMLRKLPSESSSFYGWIAYTLSRSYLTDNSSDQTYGMSSEGYQQAAFFLQPKESKRQEYLSPYDQTHILTAVGQWTLPYGFEAGFRFQLSTGTPLTNLSGNGFTFYDADTGTYRKDPRTLTSNNDRLPMFHRLDARVDKTFTFDLWKLGVYLEVLNVYNHQDVMLMVDDYRFEERAPVTFLPIFPMLGFKGEF